MSAAGADESSDSEGTLGFLAGHPSILRSVAELTRMLEGATAPIPTRLGRFQVESELGRGGMSVVVAAIDGSHGGRVALKLVHRSESRARAALASEARVLREVRHPHLVRGIDHGVTDDWAWLALEMVPGRSMQQWIADRRDATPVGRLPTEHVRRVLRWMREIALALGELHARGYVHRDIKPGNVMIRPDGSACLIDMGLVQTEGAEFSSERLLAGTIPYMSPEQTLGGVVAVDRSSDIYALGVTIYEALCGQRAVRGASRDDLLMNVAFGAVAPPSRHARGVPAGFDALLRHALSKDRSRRYLDVQELLVDLDACIAGRDLIHAGEAWPARLARRARRHWRSVAGIACGAVIAVLAMVWSWSLDAAARRAALDRVRQAIAVSAPDEVLGSLGDGLRGPASSDFAAACADLGVPLEMALVDAALEALTFHLADAASVSGWSEFASVGAALQAVEARPAFVFVSVVAAFVHDGPEAARERLVASGLSGDSLLLEELDGVLALECGRRGEARALERELARRPATELRVGELAVRAYRLLRIAGDERLARRWESPRRTAALRDCGSLLGVLRSQSDSTAFLDACGALYLLEVGDFSGAARALGDGARAGDLGPGLHRIVAELLAGRSVVEQRTSLEELVGDGVSLADPALLWVADQLFAWGRPDVARDLLTDDSVAAGERGAVLADYLCGLGGSAGVAERWALVGFVGDVALEWVEDEVSGVAAEVVAPAVSLGVWSGIHEARAAQAVLDVGEIRACLERTRRRCARALSHLSWLDRDVRVILATAELIEARVSSGDAAGAAEVDAAADVLKAARDALEAQRDPSAVELVRFVDAVLEDR